jgi:hypothetical protein
LKSSTVFNQARATRSNIATLYEAGETGHFVHFYEDDRFALENIGRLASKRMAAGDSGVFVATRPHLDIIEQRLELGGLDLKALRAQGRYVTHDADAALSGFMEDGSPNRDKFFDIVGSIISDAESRRPRSSRRRSNRWPEPSSPGMHAAIGASVTGCSTRRRQPDRARQR